MPYAQVVADKSWLLFELACGRPNFTIGSHVSFGNETYFMVSLYCLDMKGDEDIMTLQN